MAKAGRDKRAGVVLVLVLVVIVVVSLIAVTFARLMLAEVRIVNYGLRQRQARLVAESGVESLRLLLMYDELSLLELGGLYDNPSLFQGQVVFESLSMSGGDRGLMVGLRSFLDPRDCGRFSAVVPALSEDGSLLGESVRYGLEDESTKINLHWILATEVAMPGGYAKLFLMRLPGVTEELAEAILDWIDEDDEPREFGAEVEYYGTLDPPYRPRNRVPDSLDELLLVRGMTQSLLYGIDWNRNGVIDWGEPDESAMTDLGVTDGSLSLGLVSYLTLDSCETTVSPDGLPKIDLNQEDVSNLQTELTERFEEETEWVSYIVAYRGQYDKINSILDLVGEPPANTASSASSALGAVTGSTGNTASLPPSPFSMEPDEMNVYLPLLYDNLSVSATPVVGRININQASRVVLEAFSARDDDLTMMVQSTAEIFDEFNVTSDSSLAAFPATEVIEAILAVRVSDPLLRDQVEMNYPFWVYTYGLIEDFSQMRMMEPYFCCGGATFRTQIIGRFDDDRSPATRVEVWLNASDPTLPAKLLRKRELTELGPGYSAETLGCTILNTTR